MHFTRPCETGNLQEGRGEGEERGEGRGKAEHSLTGRTQPVCGGRSLMCKILGQASFILPPTLAHTLLRK